jgi:hypothetical protein
MAPLLKELSNLEVEPLQTVENAPCREGFYTVRSQESSLDGLIAAPGNFEIDALLMGKETISGANPCCCCCACCVCGCC